MTCEKEQQDLEDAIDGVEGSMTVAEATAALYECFRFMGSVYETRRSHSAGMTEIQYLRMKFILEASEALFGKIKPRPPQDIKRTFEVRNQIFGSTDKAMIFSTMLAEALKKSKIDLKEHEMVECIISVRKKPAYISELLSSSRTQGVPPLIFITEPAIMGQLMSALEKDRIQH